MEIKAQAAPKAISENLERLQSKFHLDFVPKVRVFPTPYLSSSKETFSLRTEEFGHAAAGCAEELLRQSTRRIGVSWGTTVANLVSAMEMLGCAAPRKRNPIMFLPLSGEPLGMATTHFSASTLAGRLNELLNGSKKFAHSLAAVPALIPKSFSTKDVTIIRRFITHVEAYKDIFYGGSGGSAQNEPLIETIDTVITSVGAAETTLGWGEDEFGRTASFNRVDLKELIIGDISGVLIPKPNLKNPERKKLHLIEERWTGVKEVHLKECARKANENKTSGVIIATIGANKGEIVLECIKRGLVNHLLIDQDLADKLRGLLDQES